MLGIAVAVVLLAGCGEDAIVDPPPGGAPPGNEAPVADAGPDQLLALPGTATLDGTGSSDPDGDALAYAWRLIASPPGSGAALSDSTAASPTFSADSTGAYTAHLIVGDGQLESEPDTVVISVGTAPGIRPFSRTIGAGLQFVGSAILDTANHGGITVRIESSDSTVALIAPDDTTPGSRRIDVTVPDDSLHAHYVVQGVAGAAGTVTVTVAATGFASGIGTVEVVQPGVAIGGLATNQSVGTERVFTVFLGIPDGGGMNLTGFQGASAANSPPLTLSVSGSDGAVAHLRGGGETGAAISFDLPAGTSQPQVTFVPLSAGATTVTASISGFVTTTAASVNVTVDAPGIQPYSRTVGAGLQYYSYATLEISDHGGVTVRVQSSDSTVALVAPDGDTPGASFVDVFVPDTESRAYYAVQGVAGARGAITVTVSSPGFAAGTGAIDVVQPGIAIAALSAVRSVGQNDASNVRIGIPNATGTNLSGFQGMSAANIPPLVLTVTSSNGTVGWLSGHGQNDAIITLDMTAGMFQPSFTFEPLSPGATTVSASIPGFLTTTSGTVDVTVEP